MNIDTDTQWAAWDGVRAYEAKYHDYLQSQIGNPDGDDSPNKNTTIQGNGLEQVNNRWLKGLSAPMKT